MDCATLAAALRAGSGGPMALAQAQRLLHEGLLNTTVQIIEYAEGKLDESVDLTPIVPIPCNPYENACKLFGPGFRCCRVPNDSPSFVCVNTYHPAAVMNCGACNNVCPSNQPFCAPAPSGGWGCSSSPNIDWWRDHAEDLLPLPLPV